MLNFGALITNEWIKLYKKKSFFVYLAVMAVFVGIIAYAAYRGWMSGTDSALGFVESIVSMSAAGQILPMVVIIAIANIVPQEFRMGTIKFLLIRAQSRNKILASKYVVALLFSFFLIAATWLMCLIAGLALYGFGGGGDMWPQIGENVLYLTIYTFAFVSLTFMLGVLTRSSGATVGIAMFSVMVGGLFTLLLTRYSFIKFVLFPNVDLSVYDGGGSMPHGMTLGFSATVIGAYVLLFLIASFVTFRKRDVS
ncbi:ABC transporter permease [Paenibacillus soyae]|uniref:ABC transporter permease n=1 Tax=Paenibacillus soyae TaxID=2969249 RepID=A0A9X2MP09_9BACL|nr:ABC transporter permease [Paenibacillus soyae]MCR2803815.1 ABC transporter permease [Paenibacillus soyae]